MTEMVHMTQCSYHDAKNDDARNVCIYEMHKYDAHPHELMMHTTRILQLFSRN
jgi:hypothetical protein